LLNYFYKFKINYNILGPTWTRTCCCPWPDYHLQQIPVRDVWALAIEPPVIWIFVRSWNTLLYST